MCGLSSSQVRGPAQTPSKFSQTFAGGGAVRVHPTWRDQLGPSRIFTDFYSQLGSLQSFHEFSLWVVRAHPTSWDQLGPLSDCCEFALWMVRVHPTSWDQLGPLLNSCNFCHAWSEFIPPPVTSSDLSKMQGVFRGRSSSHPLGPAPTPPSIFTNLCWGWSEFIPAPGTKTDPSQAVVNLKFAWSEFIPPLGTSSDPPISAHVHFCGMS